MKNKNIVEYERALVYCRVSSDRQVKEGSGLDSQELRCVQRAQSLNLKVAKTFPDEGVSGKLFDRPAMMDLIQFLDDHPNEHFVIIFDDLKRFARDVEVHLKLKTELVKKRKARLVCLNFNFEDSPIGRAVETILAATAQLEREQNAEQVSNKMKACLQRGHWPFHLPKGLMNIKDLKGRIITPCANEEPFASIYKEAIEKYRDFELTTMEAVRQFILEKYAVYGINLPLSLHGTHSILTEPLYCGYYEYEPWGVGFTKATHDGFISLETHKAVLERLENSAKPRLRKDYSEDFAIRNFILCPSCRKPMTASWHKGKSGKRFPHYWCKTEGCQLKNKTVLRDQVHKDFEKLLQQTKPEPKVLQLAQIVLNDMWQDREKLDEQSQKAKKVEIENIQNEIDALKSRIKKTSSDGLVKEYEKDLEALLNKKTALEAEFSKRRYSEVKFNEVTKTVFSFLEHPLEHWKSPLYRRKRILLGMYFERGIVYDRNTGFGTPDFPLIVQIITQKDTSKKHLVEMAGVKPASRTYQPFHCSQD